MFFAFYILHRPNATLKLLSLLLSLLLFLLWSVFKTEGASPAENQRLCLFYPQNIHSHHGMTNKCSLKYQSTQLEKTARSTPCQLGIPSIDADGFLLRPKRNYNRQLEAYRHHQPWHSPRSTSIREAAPDHQSRFYLPRPKVHHPPHNLRPTSTKSSNPLINVHVGPEAMPAEDEIIEIATEPLSSSANTAELCLE